MSEHQIIEVIERYLNGEMSQEERLRFEMLRQENADINSRVDEHREFTGLLKQYGERLELENRLNAIHSEIDVHALKEEVTDHPAWIVRMWRHHHSKISVAASIAIFAMLCTMYFTGYFSKNTSNYVQLVREIQSVKQNQRNLNSKTDAILNSTTPPRRHLKPGSAAGTGFALTTDGYIVTNFHVVNRADSMYVENAFGDSYHAKMVYSEPEADLAILKIDDAAFKHFNSIPYSFKRAKSDLGEEVYTVGFPRDSIVYDKGYLSSATGYDGDTSSYQVSIPVNFGNSGGPVLDNQGHVIGIIKGKQSQAEGAAFAIRSKYLLKALKGLPADSVLNKVSAESKNSLSKLSTVQQIKKLKNYVFMIKVYN